MFSDFFWKIRTILKKVSNLTEDMKVNVTDLPSPGITNEGLEVSPGTERKNKYARSDTTLTQVDLDILSAQANVGSGEKPELGTSPGDPVTQSMANFLSRPLAAGNSQHSWNPFRKQSGILKVLHAQAKRNRMVSKHGKINTIVRSDKLDVSR